MRVVILIVATLATMVLPAGAQDPQTPAARSLSLNDALELAERESESVGIAQSDLARAEGERRRARSAYFPQLTGTASYTRTLRSQFSALQGEEGGSPAPVPEECDAFVPRPGLPIEERLDSLEAAVECASNADPFAGLGEDLPFGRENSYRLGLSFSQTLFSGGRITGQTRAADASVRSAGIGLTSARAQLLLDVTQAYYDASLGDRLVAIARATLVQADTTLSQTQLARQVGNQSEFDLLRARVTRDNQRPVVIQRQASRDLAYYRLKNLLNLPLDEPLELSSELVDTALIRTARLAELVQSPGDTGTDARAPVRQASEAVISQEGLLRAARAQRWPQVSLTSDYAEIGYPDDASPFGTNYLSDWVVAVGVQVPLFTGGRVKGDVAVAEAGLEQARLRLQQTRELARLDARNAQLQLEAAVAAWEASAGTEEQADRAYVIAEVRYREGISTQTELNDLRIQLAQAQATRAQAARDLQVARMRLALLPSLPLDAAAGAAASSAAAPAVTAPGGQGDGQATPYQAPRSTTPGVLTSTRQTGAVGP
ncbi:MAG TPA: TolC family protein [Gemmatimonadales bacterium]|jgi:outer membrane protein TolC|nr:TolC family protein [Gemmatimonadales bacterium]